MWTRYVWPEIRGNFFTDKTHFIIIESFFFTLNVFFFYNSANSGNQRKVSYKWTIHCCHHFHPSNVCYLFSWTSVNPNVLSAPEILTQWAKLKDLLALLFAEIVDLRQRSHGTFSFLTITFFAVIYYIGKCVPGVILLYSFGKSCFCLTLSINHCLNCICCSYNFTVDSWIFASRFATWYARRSHQLL